MSKYKIMNSKNKQTEIKAFLSFILEQSKETGLHVSCTIMSEEDTGEGMRYLPDMFPVVRGQDYIGCFMVQ